MLKMIAVLYLQPDSAPGLLLSHEVKTDGCRRVLCFRERGTVVKRMGEFNSSI